MWAVLLAAVAVTAGCLEPLREGPADPPDLPSGAAFLGAVSTADGVAVVGALGEISAYRMDGGAYVGGMTFTTDETGEFAETLVLAGAGNFVATVEIVVFPPDSLALQPGTATGTIPFTTGITDTLRLSITLDAGPGPVGGPVSPTAR